MFETKADDFSAQTFLPPGGRAADELLVLIPPLCHLEGSHLGASPHAQDTLFYKRLCVCVCVRACLDLIFCHGISS